MPASFFVVLWVVLLVAAIVLIALSLLVMSFVQKRPKGTYRRLGALLLSWPVAITVFLFSILVYDSLLAIWTDTFPNFSDYEQAGVAKHYTLQSYELQCKHSNWSLSCIDALHEEDGVVVVSSRSEPMVWNSYNDSLVSLYRIEYVDNETKCELLDSDNDKTLLWDRYAATYSVDRDEIKTVDEYFADAIWWHLPLNAFLALLTAILAVYGAWRMGIKKKEKDENS